MTFCLYALENCLRAGKCSFIQGKFFRKGRKSKIYIGTLIELRGLIYLTFQEQYRLNN